MEYLLNFLFYNICFEFQSIFKNDIRIQKLFLTLVYHLLVGNKITKIVNEKNIFIEFHF